jgi:hypothetical protein
MDWDWLEIVVGVARNGVEKAPAIALYKDRVFRFHGVAVVSDETVTLYYVHTIGSFDFAEEVEPVRGGRVGECEEPTH